MPKASHFARKRLLSFQQSQGFLFRELPVTAIHTRTCQRHEDRKKFKYPQTSIEEVFWADVALAATAALAKREYEAAWDFIGADTKRGAARRAVLRKAWVAEREAREAIFMSLLRAGMNFLWREWKEG